MTVAEFEAFVADPPAFADLIAERKALHARLSALVPPFIIDGSVPDTDHVGAARCAGRGGGRGHRDHRHRRVLRRRQGPGVRRARPGRPRALGPGDVLVAPITDPSWTPLFLAADAVIVDVGATMSHAVIVSRELGIPCVVSAVGATRSIPDGAVIEVDGNAGTVTVLEVP